MSNLKNIAIYIRVSTDEQAEIGHSLKNQLVQARNIAKNLDGNNIVEYIDDGYSARTINRPALKKLIYDIKSKRIRHLIINDLDRFIRNVVDCENLINLCLDYDVKLHGVYFNPKINNADDRLIIRFKSAIAQHGSEKISENTIKGLRGGLLKGVYTFSKAPYGYIRKDDGKLKIDKDKIFFVKLIFNLYKNENTSIKKINEYIFNTFNIDISQSKISRILRCDKYTSSFIYRNEEYVSADYGMIEIVSKSDFIFIQKKLDSYCKKPKHIYFFKDKLICGECNTTLLGKPTKKKNGRVYIYYECKCKECKKYNKRVNQNILLKKFEKEILNKYNKYNFPFCDNDDLIKDFNLLSEKDIKEVIDNYIGFKEINL